MSVFGAYSRYYDLLYRDKDYAGEASYLRDLIHRYTPEARSVLDLGCGTGRHDFLLAEMGYEVVGVDLSEEMLAVARSQQCPPRALAPRFVRGDIRQVSLERTFDVVVALFHVMSYQVSNEDLAAALTTAARHLEPGGLFIFDFWYGPAVLTDRPAVRVKRMEGEDVSVLRVAEPILHPERNLVDVNYQILVREKATGETAELKERHQMRYLFRPEVELLLAGNGMSVLDCSEWLTRRPSGFDTWGVCVVAQRDKA
jgi:SAM-dependent methyltransferase